MGIIEYIKKNGILKFFKNYGWFVWVVLFFLLWLVILPIATGEIWTGYDMHSIALLFIVLHVLTAFLTGK